MATLVLSTVGNALGGPVGGAIGALIGQSIDQKLLGSGQKGPRLGDLSVQTSTYGTQIPRIYGRMRAAGTVVWATDLVESKNSGDAKGPPETTYSYSVSLAVALSSRPIVGVGRIWADGKLLRGQAGDLKVGGKFRLLHGDEDQESDPFIASVEGVRETPAYRGVALAIFEGLELSSFGNRIPFMTFEVIADGDPPTIGAILTDASGGLIASQAAAGIAGFAASGPSIKAAVEPLTDAFGLLSYDDGSLLRQVDGGAAAAVQADELGCSPDADQVARIQREQTPVQALPGIMRLGYYDAARDFQSGEARASVGAAAGTEARTELPAVMDAADAKSLVQQMLALQWARRDKLTLRLPPTYLDLKPGDRLALEQSPRIWIVEQCVLDGFAAVVELRPAWSSSPSIAADAGRIAAQSDVVAADLELAFFDVPDVLGLGGSTPTLLLAASSSSAGWTPRPVELEVGHQELQQSTATRKTVLGHSIDVLADGDPYVIDRRSSVDIQLVDKDQWLVSCDDDALVGGTNLAVLGSELFQFGQAEALGAGRFRLSRLLRGRSGTEWASLAHASGEPFAMIDRDGLRPVSFPTWTAGAQAAASTINLSGTTSETAATVSAEALRPPTPVRLRAAVNGGEVKLSWSRRSRSGFAWNDGMDAPLGETRELYRVTINGPTGSRQVDAAVSEATIATADLADVGMGEVSVEVRQVGDWAISRPATATITL